MENETMERMVAAEQAFAAWRQQKKSRGECIPAGLWEMAAGLVGPFKLAKVCKRLRLGPRELKAKIQAMGTVSAKPLKRNQEKGNSQIAQVPLTFLSTELGKRHPKSESSELKVCLKKGNGDQLEVQGISLDGRDLAQVIAAFLGT